MNRRLFLFFGGVALATCAASAWAGPFDKAELRGTTDRDPVSYKANEKIVFTLALTGADHGYIPPKPVIQTIQGGK